MSQLLNEMDGIESLVNVIVIAATNKPDLIVNTWCQDIVLLFSVG